jgi:hypothetical protein
MWIKILKYISLATASTSSGLLLLYMIITGMMMRNARKMIKKPFNVSISIGYFGILVIIAALGWSAYALLK